MKKRYKILIIAAIWIIIYFLPSIILFLNNDRYSNPLIAGEFKVDTIDKIEIIPVDSPPILITDKETIDNITACFRIGIAVKSGFYDLLSTGGCGGTHWNTAFNIVFHSKDKSFQMGFSDCDATHQHSVSKEFISYDNVFECILVYKARYHFTEYDPQKLRRVLESLSEIRYV